MSDGDSGDSDDSGSGDGDDDGEEKKKQDVKNTATTGGRVFDNDGFEVVTNDKKGRRK